MISFSLPLLRTNWKRVISDLSGEAFSFVLDLCQVIDTACIRGLWLDLSHQVIALGTSQKTEPVLPIYLHLRKVVYRTKLKRLLIPLSEIRFTGAR